MILDVTSSNFTFSSDWDSSLKLGEDYRLIFLDHVCKAVESSSVRHADDESPGTVLSCLVHAELESRDE